MVRVAKRRRLFLLETLLILTATGGCNNGTGAGGHAVTPPSETEGPSVLQTEAVSLGTLKPGESAQAELVLRNPLPCPVVVNRVETSCPCVVLTELPKSIEPQQPAVLDVSYTHERPDFRGGLAVKLVGRDPDGKELFRTEVSLFVGD